MKKKKKKKKREKNLLNSHIPFPIRHSILPNAPWLTEPLSLLIEIAGIEN